MAGPVIKSLLKESIKNLPETYSRKSAAGAISDLAKKGVKAEELEYAGLKLPEGKVTKQDLVKAEGFREDFFKTVETDAGYSSYSLQPNNPTYKEKVLRFKTMEDMQQEGSRYTSTHFPDVPDYLAHTRIYDDTIEGQPTRVLQEIQSDLHQQGRQGGYATGEPLSVEAVQKELDTINDANNFWYSGEGSTSFNSELHATHAMSEAYENLKSLGIRVDEESNFVGVSAESLIRTEGKKPPQSPHEKQWLKKGIERELVDAVNEGRQQLAIPIKGAVEQLHRGEGVQKWYETQVLNTAKKVAKQTNSDFEVKTVGATPEVKTLRAATDAELRSFLRQTTMIRDDRGSTKDFIEHTELLGDLSQRKRKKISELLDKSFSRTDKEDEELADLLHRNLKGLEVEGTPGVTYAVIKPKGQFSTTLYTTPSATAGATYLAYKEGYSEQDVTKQLLAQGYDEAEIAEINNDAVFIANAEAEGYNYEEALEILKAKDVQTDIEASENVSPVLGVPSADPFTGMPIVEELQEQQYEAEYGIKKDAYKVVTGTDEVTPQEFITAAKTLHPTQTSDLVTTIPAWFGSEAARRRYDYARLQGRQKIMQMAQERNINLVWEANDVGDEQWFVQTEQGLVDVTPGLWEELKSTTGEITGGVAGGIAGYRLTPGGAIPKLVGTAVGAITGAIGGSQMDYLYDALKYQEDIEAEAMAFKALNAGEIAVIGEAVGYPIAKGIGAGWRGIVAVKDMLIDGNTAGAHKALKETLFLSDSEIEEFVTNLERVVKVPGTQAEKEITAVALTAPGMQDLVKAAGLLDSKASRAVVQSINKRAKDVLQAAESVTDPKAPQLLAQDLANYVNDVKSFYNTVKAQAVQTPKGNNFTWDYDALAIDPVLERLSKNITDPAVADRYLLQAQRVRALSENRGFGDLLELRQIVNDFLYNKRIAKAKDQEMLRGIVGRIDGAIEKGAQSVLEKPDEWLANWYQARSQYSKMKQTEKTAIYRMMFDKSGKLKPVQPESVVKALTKYITALDGSFEEVMQKVPAKGRAVYEGAVIENLAQKYTVGTQGGMQAVHFPMLVKDLQQINFTTPNARAAKAAFLELGEVFQNDVALAQTSGMLQVPKFQSYLTADPVVRAKFEIASGIFNKIKTYVPGPEQRATALIRKTATLIENPLDAKTSKELMDDLGMEVNLANQVKQMQRDAVAARARGEDLVSPRVYVDKVGKLSKTKTDLAIPMHRIATLDEAKALADAEAVTVDNVDFDKLLKQRGFLAVQSGTDRVRILK